VSARKRKRRALVVIESRRLPMRRIVTPGTVRRLLARRKLSCMRVFVTGETLFRSCAKIDILQTRFNAWRTMTVATGHTAMCPE
jgi:hypothetical protein